MALKVNPASEEATRVMTRAIKHLRHREVLSKDSDVTWQLKQARIALEAKKYRMRLGLNPKRKRSARSTDPMLSLFGSAHKRGPELRHYREKWEQAQRNYMRFLHTDTQKARKWARISAKLSKRIGKVRDRSNPRRKSSGRRNPKRDGSSKLVHVGDRVYWTDPAEGDDPEGGSSSGPGRVVEISGDIIGIKKDDGGYVEAYRHELRRTNPGRRMRNPKRDGTPTRGELRKVKYVQHLKVIAEKGQEARGRIESLTGSLPKPAEGIFMPLGKRVLSRAESGPRHDDIPQQAPPVIAAASSHPEARNILSRISDIDLLLKDFKTQLHELGDSEENEPEVELVHSEIEKFARQKKALREKLEALSGASVATNPRRRGRRMSSERSHRIMRRADAAAVSIRRVRHHLRRALHVLRSTSRRRH